MRLTERDDSGYRNGAVLLNVSDQYANKLYYKLRDLEDVEDELGIDLIVFFKIYNSDHFYIKGKELPFKIRHYQKHGIVVGTNKPRYLPFKDYGKTWALDKKELL